jgi:hypothetical protein
MGPKYYWARPRSVIANPKSTIAALSPISPDCIPEEDEMPRMGDRAEAENLHLEFVSSDGVVSEQGLL